MDNKNRGKQPTGSWATVAGNQAPNGGKVNIPRAGPKNQRQKPGKVILKPKAKGNANGQGMGNARPIQRQHPLPPNPNPPNAPRPPTFRAQYLAHLNAAEASKRQQYARQHGLASPPKTMASLTAELASANATIHTLYGDLENRSAQLIEARAALDTKNSEVKGLASKVGFLESTLNKDKELREQAAEKDELIVRLQYEIAGLRDSIHTGMISVAHLYGPGSKDAFYGVAVREAKTIGQATRNGAPGQPKPQLAQSSKPASAQPGPVQGGQATRPPAAGPTDEATNAPRGTSQQDQHAQPKAVGLAPAQEAVPPAEVNRAVEEGRPPFDAPSSEQPRAGTPEGATADAPIDSGTREGTEGTTNAQGSAIVNDGDSSVQKDQPEVARALPSPSPSPSPPTQVAGVPPPQSTGAAPPQSTGAAPPQSTGAAPAQGTGAPPAQVAEQGNVDPASNNDGWVNVGGKSKQAPKPKDKKIRKGKSKGKGQPNPVVAGSTPAQITGAQQQRAPAPVQTRGQGQAQGQAQGQGQGQKSGGKSGKKPKGTVIGSNSKFSQKPTKPQGAQAAAKQGGQAVAGPSAPNGKQQGQAKAGPSAPAGKKANQAAAGPSAPGGKQGSKNVAGPSNAKGKKPDSKKKQPVTKPQPKPSGSGSAAPATKKNNQP
ncbi:hypothetical protein F4804DRAFT_78723 [Jackrogersella minutella]|nr:hypothetical protein F4804DRAFT_78723 [Jackrogersella minutella]